MNAENFSRYLQDRSLLHQLPFEELKTLAMQYPYCQPLQLLLLRKSLQDNREDWASALAKVAATTSDRGLLYAEVAENFQPVEEESLFHLNEDYLELHSLEKDEEALELANLDTEANTSELPLEIDFSPGAPETTGEADYSPESDTPTAGAGEGLDLSFAEEGELPEDPVEAWKKQELEELESALNKATADTVALSGREKGKVHLNYMALANPLDHAIAIATTVAELTAPSVRYTTAGTGGADRMAPHEPLHNPAPSPRPKSSFTSWVAQFQPPDIQTQLSDIMESQKMEDKRQYRKKKNRQIASSVDKIVSQSITENGDLVSETLARVLARQGQYDKAEEMYRRLMLVFPEKSDYFAQQILNIKSD
ncbi:MAG: hypothetical protein RIC19_06485 [Phaeodactylibacter sp.]|uniref:hypothetical protein n=1 Tax=Phaeodactylibacter sp. TaxID=1940289 RepID=UPI0032EEDB5F